MQVHERSLPGVGHKCTVRPRAGGELVVVVHHSGRRELLYFAPDEERPRIMLELADGEARQLGAIMAGMLFQPKLSARSARALALMRLLAVIRGSDMLIYDPSPDTRLEPSDIIVVIGARGAVSDFRTRLEGLSPRAKAWPNSRSAHSCLRWARWSCTGCGCFPSALSGLAIALSVVALVVRIPLGYQSGRATGLGSGPAWTASLLLLPCGEFNLVIAALGPLAGGVSLVAQVAVLTVLLSIPLGTVLARYAPELAALAREGAAPQSAAPRSRGTDAAD